MARHLERGGTRTKAQLHLSLRSERTWGGKRAGAGRKPRAGAKVLHRSRGTIRLAHPCHITLRVRRGLPSLRTRGFVRRFETSLRRACDRADFRVVHYSLQRDHAHLIVEANHAGSLARGMKAVGARLARAVQRSFQVRGRVLSDRYHLRALKTPREARNAIAYVLLNLRKHLAQRGRSAKDMPRGLDGASSGRWFDGWLRVGRDPAVTPLPGNPPGESASVAEPRSWLLRVGWQRHGCIDPCEIPGGTRGPR